MRRRCYRLLFLRLPHLNGFIRRSHPFHGYHTHQIVQSLSARTDRYVVDWEQDMQDETASTWNGLKPFFRQNYDRRKTIPSPKQGDVLWWMYDDDDDDDRKSRIIASLRLVSPRDGFYFLRYVCVARECRRQGFATKLLREALTMTAPSDNDDHEQRQQPRDVYCFAHPNLQPLYEAVGFDVVATSVSSIDESPFFNTQQTPLPTWMKDQYKRLARRKEARGASVSWFVKKKKKHQQAITPIISSPVSRLPSSSLRIILLQHSNEVNRPTSTGHLCKGLVDLTTWVWSGRADNYRIGKSIDNECYDNNGDTVTPILLWTDKSSSASSNSIFSIDNDQGDTQQEKSLPSTYIILDGTWQEAQSMYRKIAALHSLPRRSFRSTITISSTYKLRGNYGWKDKWKSDNDISSSVALLCTAEVIALLLDRNQQQDHSNCGEAKEGTTPAEELRQRLADFQRNYYRE